MLGDLFACFRRQESDAIIDEFLLALKSYATTLELESMSASPCIYCECEGRFRDRIHPNFPLAHHLPADSAVNQNSTISWKHPICRHHSRRIR